MTINLLPLRLVGWAWLLPQMLTITVACVIKGKTVTFPQTPNLLSGKCSTHRTDFSEATWGKNTCAYATLAWSLTKVKFKVIIQDAQQFMKPAHSHKKTTTEAMNVDRDDNEHANLVDNSDSGLDMDTDVVEDSE
ncbi:hypothetical protein EDB85DRAFT_1899174 [Lactarius pseudohatsudake]|nr:hypothetical protein EDB85DRAFT_1899174 [Lactarius pseudohatsudake]